MAVHVFKTSLQLIETPAAQLLTISVALAEQIRSDSICPRFVKMKATECP